MTARVQRLLSAVALSAIAVLPVPASAAPTPSPSLSTLLAQPPSGFSELPSAPFHGSFTAHEYAQASDSDKAVEIEATLKQYGFVDGFGKTWIHNTDRHALVEAVIAFTGNKGARDWLKSAEAGDKQDPAYSHADTIDGISPYYGGHFKYSSTTTEGDVFSFVKGNNVFIVGFVSTTNDVLELTRSQTKAQYNSAPKETIPSSQWPENQNKGSSVAYIVGYSVIPLVVIIALTVIAVGIIRNRRRGSMGPAMAGATGTAGPAGVQMSGDGKYWWDGQAWRDTATEAPPSAQRSADGALWWDGQSWRPVPGAGQPDPPPSPPAG